MAKMPAILHSPHPGPLPQDYMAVPSPRQGPTPHLKSALGLVLTIRFHS